MNWNRIRRKTPSISSNSSVFSGSSVQSAPSSVVAPVELSGGPQSIYGCVPAAHPQCQCQHSVTNFHHHHHHHPNNHEGPPQQQQPASNGYEAEYGTISTIKRKPNLNPVIPLTSTTRNMARQSEDALIEINDQQPPVNGLQNGQKPGAENRNQYYGTLRRSNTDERIQINQIFDSTASRAMVDRATADGPPLRHAHSSTSSSGVYSLGNGDRSSPSHSSARSIGGCSSICTTNESDEDEFMVLPPPPPMDPKMSLSTVSLASLPPPPPEFDGGNSEYGSPDDSDCLSSATPKALSPTIEVAPSSRYNSFDRTLTRKRVNGCKQATTHFGTGPRHSHGRPQLFKSVGSGGSDCCSANTDTCRSLSPTHSMTDCDCSPTSDLPPPLPSLHALNALQSLQQDTKYRPMYSSSSSCDSTSHDDYTSSCATDTTLSRQSPDRFDVLEQLEMQANHLANHPQVAHVAPLPTVISKASPSQFPEPVKPAAIIAQPANNNSNYKPTVVVPQNGHTKQQQQSQPNSANPINSQTYVAREKPTIIAASFNDPPPDRSPCKGPLPQAPDEFLKDLIKVMDKKWKVALSLSSCEQAAQPAQVLGFRDAHPLDAMLPTPNHQKPQQQVIQPQHIAPTAVAPSSGPITAHADSAIYAERKPPMQLAAVRPSIKQIEAHTPAVSSFAPQFKAATPASVQPVLQNGQGQPPMRPANNNQIYQSSFQQQSFQLQHRLQQGHNGSPLPVPMPFHRKSKPPPPAPPKRSGSKLSSIKLLS